MKIIELCDGWSLRQAESKKSYLAQVPGCIALDLQRGGVVSDADIYKQVASNAWVYEKSFDMDEATAYDRAVLCLDGLVGTATITLNGQELGKRANRFDPFECDVTALLKKERNLLTLNYEAAGEVEFPSEHVVAPQFPITGLNGKALLELHKSVRIRDLLIRQNRGEQSVVMLEVEIEIESFDSEVRFEAYARTLYRDGFQCEARGSFINGRTTLHLAIKNAQIWWPVGMGDQPLYEVLIDVLCEKNPLVQIKKRIGLREFKVESTSVDGRQRRQFFVNGMPFLLKGASWTPLDALAVRLTRVDYARIVQAAAVANYNCLRVWGGGTYEQRAFYELCDEYGICVLHDFMVTDRCSAQPHDAQVASFRREARTVVGKLRDHACMFAWCGGDAGETGVHAAYQEVARAVLREVDPGRAFLPAMPHRPYSLGGVGCQELPPSLPGPPIMRGLLKEDERNITHPACQRHISSQNSKRIYAGFIDNFLLPSDFCGTLWLSQIQQGVAALECFRKVRFSDNGEGGFVFWRLFDKESCGSTSALDIEGYWKALNHVARRFFAPLSLCMRRNGDKVEILAVHERIGVSFKGELLWSLCKMDGTKVVGEKIVIELPQVTTKLVAEIPVTEALKEHGAENLILFATLLDRHGSTQAIDALTFCKWSELNTQPPLLRAEVRVQDSNSFAVTLTSRTPALWVWLTVSGSNARYDNNFFCLEPERPLRVRVTPVVRMKLDEFRERLRISSLRETWQDRGAMMQRLLNVKKTRGRGDSQ